MGTIKDLMQPPCGRNWKLQEIQILEFQSIITFFDQILLNYDLL
jgi:hypothetical protein